MEIGTVVKLKSGSPKMTVEAVSESSISCVWFEPLTNHIGGDDRYGSVCRDRFAPENIETA